jgi:hypothetical protein
MEKLIREEFLDHCVVQMIGRGLLAAATSNGRLLMRSVGRGNEMSRMGGRLWQAEVEWVHRERGSGCMITTAVAASVDDRSSRFPPTSVSILRSSLPHIFQARKSFIYYSWPARGREKHITRTSQALQIQGGYD